MMSKEEATEVVNEVITLLEEKERLLPGGYLFLSDLVGNPSLLNKVGKLIASIYMEEKIRCCCYHCDKRYFIGKCGC